ncbi:hypothetical protein [Undibacterium baiyunense]|uniref:Uncharacterized protein n=1 Tax=Undibacterium baiyunense TaxID=2828731 RepID=A0A941DHZ2_9BURK|nr:hypothetical protein [Undibacterium baiyunense]MBR7747242.1 hypothetical protein [Undibacterium baiyunense]
MNALELLKTELCEAENILSTEFSFEMAEPSYQRFLALVNVGEVSREEVSTLITSMFKNGEISEEPVAYLMHVLRWGEVKEWVERSLAGMANPMLHGRQLEKILEAYSDSWENREFYSCLKINGEAFNV